MSIYFNAFFMLVATVAAFVLLARLVQTVRQRGFVSPFVAGASVRSPGTPARLAVEQICMIDSKRRLLLIRCDRQHVLLLTGGPADMVVSMLPEKRAADLEP